MKIIYFTDENGRKVYVEVTDEVAENFRALQQEEWKTDAYEKYHTRSLEWLTEKGREFADESSDTERIYLEREEHLSRKNMHTKLKKAMSQLSAIQQATVHKLFVLNMTQAEIAREENVARSTIKERVDGIYAKLRKLLKIN